MFGEPVTEAAGLCEAVATHASAGAAKLRKAGMVAAGANVFVQECAPPGTGGWTDSNWWTPFIAATVPFESPTSATSEICPPCVPPSKNCSSPASDTAGLASSSSASKTKPPPERPASKLSAVADVINARLGRGTVFFAAIGTTRKWKMKREMLSSRFTTDWDELLVVK